MDWLRVASFGAPLVGSTFLLIAVLVAFRKRSALYDGHNIDLSERAEGLSAREWELKYSADMETSGQQIKRLTEYEKSKTNSKLRIHSAFYGVGNHNDIDLRDSLQKLVPKDGLAITVDNNLITGIADPAPNQPKHLKVGYSFGGPDVISLVVQEHSMLVLPTDVDREREIGKHYDLAREKAVESAVKDLSDSFMKTTPESQSKINQLILDLNRCGAAKKDLADEIERMKAAIEDKLNLYGLPQSATGGDAARRRRAVDAFKRLSVPQKFVLRWVSKYERVSRTELIRFGQESGLGEDISGHVNHMSLYCELVKTETNNDLTINPAFLDDVDHILTAWFMRISSASEPL